MTSIVDVLEDRLAELIYIAQPFTADDLTFQGRLAVDQAHGPNGAQNVIGALFRRHSQAGHITWTGTVRRSSSPLRKGGLVREWSPTEGGYWWAVAREAEREPSTWAQEPLPFAQRPAPPSAGTDRPRGLRRRSQPL